MADDGVLRPEHELLGAQMAESDQTGVAVPQSYLNELPLVEALHGVALADLTGAAYELVSGASAQALVECACAGRRLAVGECGFEAILTGDGAVASVPLVLRTGDSEYALVDLSPRGATAVAWLGFLAQVHDGSHEAFPGAVVEDASALLVPLLLWGAAASSVLGDYLTQGEALPAPGEVASLALDRIQTVCARVPLPNETPCYLVLVPPARARAVWRSLLSFGAVSPVGHAALADGLARSLPWWHLLEHEGSLRMATPDLVRWELVRGDGGFVGIRGLDGQK